MKILTLIGQIEILSGLHIGGGDDTMKIGGIDNQVIKNINTNKPYIPGSSLKGKMRSLLEWNGKLVAPFEDGKPFGSEKLEKILDSQDKQNAINLIKLFGDSNSKNKGEYGITRISVGDCSLIEEGLQTSEAKYENVIDRKSGTAQHPRQTERVPAGVKFNFNIKLKVLDGDDETALKSMIEKGLELVENDYLGGSGSRGYGRVAFTNKEWR
jgi:CRISPR-associated protein Csm3